MHWTPPPRYRVCLRCRGPARRQRRYDAQQRLYVDVFVCPVCDPPGSS